MEKNYKYNAFISYRHISPDKEIADKLQKKLENYKPPRSLSNGKRSAWRIFRDETELPTSSNLSNDIKTALEESEFLIVICSKTTGESRWCMEEVEYFKKLHNGNNANIITLVADGNPEDVFPPSLCNELIQVTDELGNTTYQSHVIEPLAANVTGKNLKDSLKKLNTEFLRIVAPILGCGYDNLYNREHKKKIRRILTIGGIVLSLLLLFAVYNSAMLLKINTQRIALAAANEDLQKKTEELNLSNENLKKSNEDLAKKTKEAEDNLAEANKQKQVAETNLAEAEKQRRIAEQNLAEANRQKKIAEDNLTEANRQQAIAEANAQEAQTQRGIAEENMRIAQENEAKANEANKNLREKTSEILANQAQIYYDNDNISAAVQTALDAISLSEENTSTNAIAENTLVKATGAYSHAERMLCKIVNLSGYVKELEFSLDGTRILATDSNGIVYVINYENGTILNTYTPLDTFGSTNSTIDVCVDGNTGYVLCREQLLSINLKDGTVNWHYNKGHNTYIYSSEIINNPESKYIVLAGGSYPIVINKANGEYIPAFDDDKGLSYGNWDDHYHLGCDEKLYVANPESKSLKVFDINRKNVETYTINVDEVSDILSIGESDNSIYLNIVTTEEYEKDDALLISYNKSDMSVKWSTPYTCGFLGKYKLNKIFEHTHKISDETGEYFVVTGVVAVSGNNVMAFEKEKGSLYYKTEQDYEDEILYCEPNGDYSLRIATSQMFALETYLVKGNGVIADEDTFLNVDHNYTFDKKRKYIAYAEGNKFALASENSSEISLYYGHKDSNYTLLTNLPEIKYLSFDKCVDNGNGIIVGYYYEYDEEKKNYLMIYDVNNDRLLAHLQNTDDVDKMSFMSENILFAIDRDGNATAYKTDGSVMAKGDIHQLICDVTGIEKKSYLSTYDSLLSPTKNGILYCNSYGVYEILIDNNTFKVNKILYNENLGIYCRTNDFISFVKQDYRSDSYKICYFKNGDSRISYVQENGIDSEFKRGSILSVINNGNYEIAFISKEGYIGVYKYGEDGIKRITLPQGEVAPLKILFTPDSKYIIALCSNGDFVKYSVESLKEVARYTSSLVVDSSSIYEFVDDTTFIAKKYEGSKDVILIDINTMNLKAEITDFMYFMKKDKKIIFYTYIENRRTIGYYKYLSQNELVNFAKSFLSEMGE